ncbi:uncharacterized protein LOC126670336 [Mercurialis annua]|uniref:uncharacterized protein LOC126670336 n=1 Tax=Mercurialis annua TaxID=3986 RepID=UPI0021610347|nr:uncharacterized protein LOC126670336 [Mercurialis annua]
MSKSRLFKHLSYTLNRSSLFVSPLSNFKPKCQFQSQSTNSPFFFQKLNTTRPLPSSNSSSSIAAHTSSSSSYLCVRIRCPGQHVADMLSEALLCFGASSVSIDQPDDDDDDEFDSSNEICMDSIFTECQDVDACVSQAADSIGLKEIPNYEIKKGEQYDWVRKSQESFFPVQVTEGLWIVPEWRTAPNISATNIILNPGLAFGTGEHPTTKLCLLLLKGLIRGGELFLDYGTGSGILAIAALKFGAARSVGVDIDPQAITSARHNSALNNIERETMDLVLVPGNTSSTLMENRTNARDGSSDHGMEFIAEAGKFDVVVANILLNPLLELADHIVSHAKPSAVVAVSGIISEQVSDIMDRYSVLLEDISVSEMDGWAIVSGRKRNSDDV